MILFFLFIEGHTSRNCWGQPKAAQLRKHAYKRKKKCLQLSELPERPYKLKMASDEAWTATLGESEQKIRRQNELDQGNGDMSSRSQKCYVDF